MYGIWNARDKRFVFGIKEDTKDKAMSAFKTKAPGQWRHWRYEIRRIPNRFRNPPNPRYAKEQEGRR